MNLGNLAGGFAKGYQEAEELRIKREAADRAKRTGERQDEQWRREDEDRAAGKAAPTIGADISTDYDPKAAVQAAIKSGMPAPTQPRRSPLAEIGGRIAGALRPKEAAIGAGVLPPPAPPVDPALKAQGSEAARAPAAAGEVEPVTVAPTKQAATRKATKADVLMYELARAEQRGAPGTERMKLLDDLHTENTKQALRWVGTASPSELTNTFQKMDMDVTVMNGEKEGTFVVIDPSGNETQVADRKELMAMATGIIEGDPQKSFAMLMSINKDKREDLELAETRRYHTGVLKNAAAQIGVQREGIALQRDKYEFEKAEAAELKEALEIVANPSAALLNPERATRAKATVTRYMPGYAEGQVREGDVSRSANIIDLDTDALRAKIAKSPVASNIEIKQVGGQGYFVVKGDKPGVGYDDWYDAENAALRLSRKDKTPALPKTR